jgi:hypothetical protein
VQQALNCTASPVSRLSSTRLTVDTSALFSYNCFVR